MKPEVDYCTEVTRLGGAPDNEKLPLILEGVSVLWRIGVITCLAKMWLVEGRFVFSDYKSDYFCVVSWGSLEFFHAHLDVI